MSTKRQRADLQARPGTAAVTRREPPARRPTLAPAGQLRRARGGAARRPGLPGRGAGGREAPRLHGARSYAAAAGVGARGASPGIRQATRHGRLLLLLLLLLPAPTAFSLPPGSLRWVGGGVPGPHAQLWLGLPCCDQPVPLLSPKRLDCVESTPLLSRLALCACLPVSVSMSWQHLNQPWGWIGVILLSLSLSPALCGWIGAILYLYSTPLPRDHVARADPSACRFRHVTNGMIC